MAESKTKGKYFEGVGRRKTAIARVRIVKGAGDMVINDKKLSDYFPVERDQATVLSPVTKLKMEKDFHSTVKVVGGGVQAQVEAVRLGLARALTASDESLRLRLRSMGYMTRDPRMVERKKYGLKKARRAPQWAKR